MASRMIDKTIGGVHVQAFSMAGEETVICLPEFTVAFDVGRAPREIIGIEHVLLSHGHMDHAAGVAYYFSQRAFQGAPPGTVVAPHRLAAGLKELMQAWARIEGHVSPHQIIGVDEDEDVEVRPGLIARPFRVCHPGPTLGYSLIEVRKKLKPEYTTLSGQQIAALKRSGQAVEYRLELPQVAYCADTEPGPFLDHDHVRNAPVLFYECTFFEPDHEERARKGQHTHVRDLPAVLERVRSPHVVIFHITRRTFMREVKQTLQRLLRKQDLERITLLMDLPRRERFDPSGKPAASTPASSPPGSS